ncbi:MAG: hypothetical protein WC932_04940 [archaeon]|jgi:hypothetical protein
MSEKVTEPSKVIAPSAEMIAELKNRYGVLFKVSYNSSSNYLIRPITRAEYKDVVAVIETVDAKLRPELHDENVVKLGVVWPTLPPEFFTTSAAGQVPNLALQIMERSGFSNNVDVTEV